MKFKAVHGAPTLLCVITAMLIGFHFLDLSAIGGEENLYLTVITAQLIIFALPAIFYSRLRGRKYLSHLRIRLVKVSDFPLMLFALGLMISGGAALCFVMYRFFPEAFAAGAAYSITDATGTVSGSSLYSVVAFALLPAVTEEFLYRGVIIAEYERCGAPLAVLLSSFTFSLIHFNLIRLPVYFFYGVVLSLVLYATRSVVASTVIHTANNIFVMFFEVYVQRAAVKQGGGLVMFGFICVSLFLLFAVLFFGSAQKSYSDMAYDNIPSEYAVRKRPGFAPALAKAVISPAFILLIIISVAGMFVCGNG